MREVTWGEVTQISPSVEVRLVGDSADTPVALKIDGVTLAVNDKVAVAKAGAVGGLFIIGKLVASA